ncbi:MAG: DUF4838 domain-containing protein, partial [Chloroflexi bacterium]|nr:DUF4838 domain-containing protein [Chloroflexota bacterium]
MTGSDQHPLSARWTRRKFVRSVAQATAGAGFALSERADASAPIKPTPAGKNVVLVENNQARATIVTAAHANDKVTAAADDLSLYLQKISGAKPPRSLDTENVQGTVILVGKSKKTEAAHVRVPSGLTPARREEGFVIHCQGNILALAGNDDGPYHGTEYAVYEFLNRLGVRWFMPGDYGEVVPRLSTVIFPELIHTASPDFVMRNWWLHTTPALAELELRWKLRNKMNPEPMFAIPGDGSARNLVPAATYFKDHPEYFAQSADGSHDPNLPNLTHAKSVEIAANTIRDFFRKNPGANSYSFAPDDGMPRDYSPTTLEENQGFVELGGRPGVPGDASASEEWFTFVSNVTAAVRGEFPAVYIATNGYANRDIPPQGVALDDHLVIMFAAIWSCTLHAFDDPHCWQKVRQGEMLRRWTSLCKNVWVYGYNYQMMVSCLTPLPETRKISRDLPLMKAWGVLGFDDEARNAWAECGIPSRYLRARLEWDTAASVPEILGDFYGEWYGRAARPMQQFYDAIEDRIEKTALHGHEDRMLPPVYSPDLMAALPGYLAEAERLADTPDSITHLRADRLIYDHLAAYVAMSDAEAAGDFAKAAAQAQRMLDLRKQLNAINPFYMWPNEERYDSGVWYWGATERRDFYQSLADKRSGKTGELVTLLPEEWLFRLDPQDDGRFQEWYAPGGPEAGWQPISTTRPFYSQGFEDAAGHPYVGILWYRTTTSLPASVEEKKVHFYAPTIETEAWIWVNGKY